MEGPLPGGSGREERIATRRARIQARIQATRDAADGGENTWHAHRGSGAVAAAMVSAAVGDSMPSGHPPQAAGHPVPIWCEGALAVLLVSIALRMFLMEMFYSSTLATGEPVHPTSCSCSLC